ncbi:MAG: S24 family peptidase [Aestuariivirga sp.]
MAKLINRRFAIAGTIAAAIPLQAEAGTKQAPDGCSHLTQALQGLVGVEVTGNSFEPHHRAGTLLFIKPGSADPADHVCVIRKTGAHVIASLVHRDEKAMYLRGFNAGDRLQAVPLNTVSQWGRIVVAFKP